MTLGFALKSNAGAGNWRLVRRESYSVFVIFLLLAASNCLRAQMPEAPTDEPLLNFSFPLGGQKGASFEVEVKGSNLAGAYAVWTDCAELKGRVLKIEESELEKKSKDAVQGNEEKKLLLGQRVLLEVTASPSAPLGSHEFRLVCPAGITNALTVQVAAEPVASEKAEDHSQSESAQALDIPALVNGNLKEPGEVDYYSFEAKSGQEFAMEVGSAGRKLNPILTLFDSSRSWFDSKRLKRLAFNDNANGRTKGARLRYRFARAGRYTVAVGAFVGVVDSESSYQLRIVPVESSISETGQVFTETPAHPEKAGWTERNFARDLSTDRLQALWKRAVRLPQKEKREASTSAVSAVGSPPSAQKALERDEEPVMSTAQITVLKEQEPNDALAQALEIKLPVILKGAIAVAGDIDNFSFSAKGGQAVAIEIQTPLETPNRFNPRITILDANAKEVAVNVYSRLGGDGDDWILSSEPKLTYTFERAGSYQLQIRDVTSRLGGSRFVYRLLVRPQLPHVGAVEVMEDRANLITGKAKKLTVRVEQEEGFSGDLLIEVENLPPGVKCFPAAEVEPEVGPALERIHPERYLPKKQKVTLVLVPEAGAPVTQLPSLALMTFRPIVDGNPGSLVRVKEIPIMVLNSHKDSGAH